MASSNVDHLFDLKRFSRAIEIGAVDYLTAQYSPNAQLQLMEPDSPPDQPTVLIGQAAIRAWRQTLWVDYATHSVVTYLAADERLMFVEQRVHYEGMVAVASSMAELAGGLISAQYTTTVWDLGSQTRSVDNARSHHQESSPRKQPRLVTQR